MTRLKKPVGQSVKNDPADAKYVQFLLNDWRHAKRITPPLAVDGIVGPLTNAAIRDFQKVETGFVDGQVDVNGATIKKLEYLHLSRIDSQVNTLAHYGILSMKLPPMGPLTLLGQAVRYLTALRRSQG